MESHRPMLDMEVAMARSPVVLMGRDAATHAFIKGLRKADSGLRIQVIQGNPAIAAEVEIVSAIGPVRAVDHGVYDVIRMLHPAPFIAQDTELIRSGLIDRLCHRGIMSTAPLVEHGPGKLLLNHRELCEKLRSLEIPCMESWADSPGEPERLTRIWVPVMCSGDAGRVLPIVEVKCVRHGEAMTPVQAATKSFGQIRGEWLDPNEVLARLLHDGRVHKKPFRGLFTLSYVWSQTRWRIDNIFIGIPDPACGIVMMKWSNGIYPWLLGVARGSFPKDIPWESDASFAAQKLFFSVQASRNPNEFLSTLEAQAAPDVWVLGDSGLVSSSAASADVLPVYTLVASGKTVEEAQGRIDQVIEASTWSGEVF